MKLVLFVALLALSTMASAQDCNGPSGAYAGFGYAKNLRTNAAYGYRGHLYGGYRLCNGLQAEFRHTSGLGTDDGVDVTGDNENDISTSENSLGVYYTVWFK